MTLTIEISEQDPMFASLVELLSRVKPKAELTSTPASEEPSPKPILEQMISLAEVEAVVDRLGLGSKRFLRIVVDACRKAGGLSFTIPDLVSVSGDQEKNLRANNRNVAKSAKSVGVKLFERAWDGRAGRQVFSMRQAVLDALDGLVP